MSFVCITLHIDIIGGASLICYQQNAGTYHEEKHKLKVHCKINTSNLHIIFVYRNIPWQGLESNRDLNQQTTMTQLHQVPGYYFLNLTKFTFIFHRRPSYYICASVL